jgi:hypothetical protein
MPLLLGAVALAGLLLASRKARAQSGAGDCEGSPPSRQPAVPAGFRPFRGAVGPAAQQAARNALSEPLGAFATFEDEQGRELGVLVSWHCHAADSGMRPVGWHKGANLFERVG